MILLLSVLDSYENPKNQKSVIYEWEVYLLMDVS